MATVLIMFYICILCGVVSKRSHGTSNAFNFTGYLLVLSSVRLALDIFFIIIFALMFWSTIYCFNLRKDSLSQFHSLSFVTWNSCGTKCTDHRFLANAFLNFPDFFQCLPNGSWNSTNHSDGKISSIRTRRMSNCLLLSLDSNFDLGNQFLHINSIFQYFWNSVFHLFSSRISTKSNFQ